MTDWTIPVRIVELSRGMKAHSRSLKTWAEVENMMAFLKLR